jgi:outer membrane protein TolC
MCGLEAARGGFHPSSRDRVVPSTIDGALVRAYDLSGYRPKVALTASAGVQYTDVNTTAGGSPTALVRTEVHGVNAPRSAGLTVSQTLYRGQQTTDRTRAAESQVSDAREGCGC